MGHDKMTRLEKAALASAVAGAVFNVFLYGIGASLRDAPMGMSLLFGVRLLASLLTAASFDLVAVATVMGMREGRRSTWSWGTAVSAAGVSAFIALDVAGVWAQPWLHAANALIVLAFTLHLLTPRRSSRGQQLRRLVRRLAAAVRAERQKLASAWQDLAGARQAVADLRQELAERDNALALARQELASRPAPLKIDAVRVVRFELTWDQLWQLILLVRQAETISLTSVRRRVAEIAGPMAKEG